MHISVIGCGRLGAPYAAGMARLGHHVLGVDTNPDTIAVLEAGRAPFAEPELAEAIVEGAQTGRLTFTDSYPQAAMHADVHILAVPTPQSAGSWDHDLTDVFTAAEALVAALDHDALLVVKSSVPAGTCDQLAMRLAEVARPGVRVEVAASPDFMREGRSITDVCHPSRIVLGVQPAGRAEVVLRELWAPCLKAGVPLVVTDLRTAETCKLAANVCLATRISLVNALAEFACAAGIDTAGLVRVLGHDPRIGSDYLTPGIGFGGSCLTKDLRGLAALASRHDVPLVRGLLTAVDEVNQGRRVRAAELAVSACGGSIDGQRIGVWGASFKAGIDDIRDSPALDVAERLRRAGARVTVYDPQACVHARREHPDLAYASNPLHAASGARVLMHLTDWPQFRQIDPHALSAAEHPTLIDCRPGLDHDRWQAAGWSVTTL